jgi:hypothetical protein
MPIDPLRDARAWIEDCDETLSPQISDQTIIMLVHRNFVGGWEGFIASDKTLDAKLIWALLTTKFGAVFTMRLYDKIPE